MAKGNPLLGQLRGSVGDVVFSRFGGQQVSRSRNRNPKNPQSASQMLQRAKLGSAVAFFSHGIQNLFKFAFESKKANESDYNAFMRYNIDRVAPNTKEGVKAGHPVLGNYMMSQGTLTPLSVEYEDNDVVPFLEVQELSSSITPSTFTIGQLSAALKSKYGLEEGDIITIVQIYSGNAPEETAAAAVLANSYAPGQANTKWNINQFRIDSTSTALVSSLGDLFNVEAMEFPTAVIPIGTTDHPAGSQSECYGVCAIVSRNTPAGLKVSNSYLQCNYGCNLVIDYSKSEAWQEFVASTWKAVAKTQLPADAILKGSLSAQ